jgi:PIN domain nuclease of toxin-antitoxin system
MRAPEPSSETAWNSRRSTRSQEIGIEVADGSIAELGQAAADLSWTRDPFDRLISAHAIVANALLVTADETIREHLPLAVWD